VNSTSEYQQGRMAKTTLSVVLIGPDEERRRALEQAFQQQVSITGEMGAYPNFNHLTKLTESDCDVVVVDLDQDPDVALDLIENICSRNSLITVMAYSSDQAPDLLVKCMRAGAREFLTDPLSSTALAEAVIRASARRLELDRQKRVSGKVLVFCGAKGGCGVTALAANFAIALKRESGREVNLVDLNIQLGDIGVILGLKPRFSISDALLNSERLDQDFVSTLLVEHKTGVSVLTAPDEYIPTPPVQNGNLGKLLYILRDTFPYVVVDAGPSMGATSQLIFDMADTVYLVAQTEIACLRNAQRLASHLRENSVGERRVELILNRFDPRKCEIDEARIAKLLDMPVKWRVPNDYSSVQRSLDAGEPLALQNTAVTRILYQMAREACGRPAMPDKSSKWSWF
jgi:pilus assembly protein CpaE